MKRAAFLAVAAMLVAQMPMAQEVPRLPCADADKECAQRAIKHHAAIRIDAWLAALSLPVAERIGPAPPQLVDYLNLDNIVHGISERPRAARLEARIEADGNDNRQNAIQYILLHELGHVLSIGADIHPPWNLSPKQIDSAAKYPFFDLSWTVDREADKYRSRFDANFPQRASTVYCFGAKLAAADMAATYASLKLTNFPSLYAATAPGDDFAESFASYVHVVLMQRPWQITIWHQGKPVASLRACWGEPRCAEKQQMLERLVKPAS